MRSSNTGQQKRGLFLWFADLAISNVGSITGWLKALIPAGALGVLAGWGVWAAGVLNDYAPLSWITGGAVIGFIFAAATTFIRRHWIITTAIRRHYQAHTEVNPAASEYRDARLNLAALLVPGASPIVSKKKFIDCQIVGPANLLFWRDVRRLYT